MTTNPSPAPNPRTASGPAEEFAVITEGRREQTLLATDALQNAIFNSANFSSIATDAKGVIQIFNVGAERMLGYAAADVMNKITPADISDPSEVIARAKELSVELGTPITTGFEALVYKASRGIEDIYELTYIRQDGSRFPAVVSVTALRDAQDAIIGYLLIGTDNTARKQAEAEKNKLQESSRMNQRAAELKREVIERTRTEREARENLTLADRSRRALLGVIEDQKEAEGKIRLLNAELEQRVRDRTAELQAANQELEAFSYSVSHDLRAPLRHLTGFAELLQKNDRVQFDDVARRHLTYISESAVRMGQLIDDLLAFSRSGRTELRQAPVNLDALVQEVIQGLHPDTQGRRIVWHIAPLPGVNADANLLRAALTNLFANALKFTQPRDEATIQMGCTENERERVFFIRDNGVGFDMQYVDKLFGVFQRLHATEEFEGTGIGLANVRRIITRHGGRTWAESVLNEGATFYFSLPKPTGNKHAERATT